MPKPSKANESEIYRFELQRRLDEMHAITRYAFVLFSKEIRLKDELKATEKEYNNKWIFITLLFSLILSSVLRKSGFFSFQFEWNFGTFLTTICILIYVLLLIKKYLIKNKLDSNLDRLNELAFAFDVITSEGYKLWDIRRFIDESGQIRSDDDNHTYSKDYTSWLKGVSQNLENKIHSYTHD